MNNRCAISRKKDHHFHSFVSAGFFYLKKCEGTAKFDEMAGVGVEVTPEQIAAIVTAIITDNKADVLANRYRHGPALLSEMQLDA